MRIGIVMVKLRVRSDMKLVGLLIRVDINVIGRGVRVMYGFESHDTGYHTMKRCITI